MQRTKWLRLVFMVRFSLLIMSLLIFNLPLTSAQTTITPTEIMRIGRGVAYSLDWRPDEKVLAVGTATGVWLYNDSYEVLAHFPEAGQQVAWSPDGERLLTWMNAGGGQIWRIEQDGKSSEVVLTIPHLVRGVWSPDGSMIAGRRLIGEQAAPVVWRSETGEVVFELPLENIYLDYPYINIPNFAWRSDGQQLAVGKYTSIEIRDLTLDFQVVQRLTAQTYDDRDRSVGSEIAWVGNRIFSNGDNLYDLTPFMWNTNSGELLFAPDECLQNPCNFQYISQLLPSPDHMQIAVVWGGGNLRFDTPADGADIIDAKTGEVIEQDARTGFEHVAWRGNTLTGLTHTGNFRTWDNKIPIPYLGQNEVEALVWSPDGKVLATTTREIQYPQPIFLWDITQTAALIYEPQLFLGHRGFQRELFWNEQAGLVSTADFMIQGSNRNFRLADFSVYRWLDPLNKHLDILPKSQDAWIFSWNPSLTIAVATEWGEPNGEMFRVENGQLESVRTLDIPGGGSYTEEVRNITWSLNGQKFVVTYWATDTGFSIWDIEDSSSPLTIKQLSDTQVFWRPDSEVILAVDILYGEGTTTLRLIDADSGDILATQTTPSWSDEVAWKPDGSVFAINVATEFIQFRDGETGELVAEAPIDGEYKLAWSPDGTRLALGGQDGVIRVWDVSGIGKVD